MKGTKKILIMKISSHICNFAYNKVSNYSLRFLLVKHSFELFQSFFKKQLFIKKTINILRKI